MAPEVGLEPTTKRLTAVRSTTELLGSVTKKPRFTIIPRCSAAGQYLAGS